MKIELTRTQRHQLREWVKSCTAAEVEAGVEPTGLVVIVEAHPVFGSQMRIERNGVMLDLGEVKMTLEE